MIEISNNVSNKPRWRNYTRAIKNAKFLQKVAPHIIPSKEPKEGYGSILPANILTKIHRLSYNSPELKDYSAVSNFLRENRVQVSFKMSRTGLFNGTIYFVKVTFATPSGNYSFSDADINLMILYAQHATVPISEYAKQYGSNSEIISPTAIPYTVNLEGTSYNDTDLQKWVNDIVNANNLPTSSCIVIPTPQGVSGGQFVDGNAGYHSKANVPYVVFGVFAQNLTMQDHKDVYAMVISHEIGEMIVDPNADWNVGEVGDPCDLNCGNLHRAYFDINDNYMGTNKLSPPSGYDFAYYICPVVKPEGIAHSDSDCHASEEDCSYAPK